MTQYPYPHCETHLEAVEDGVELHGILSANEMICPGSVDRLENRARNNNQCDLDEIALLRRLEAPINKQGNV